MHIIFLISTTILERILEFSWTRGKGKGGFYDIISPHQGQSQPLTKEGSFFIKMEIHVIPKGSVTPPPPPLATCTPALEAGL